MDLTPQEKHHGQIGTGCAYLLVGTVLVLAVVGLLTILTHIHFMWG